MAPGHSPLVYYCRHPWCFSSKDLILTRTKVYTVYIQNIHFLWIQMGFSIARPTERKPPSTQQETPDPFPAVFMESPSYSRSSHNDRLPAGSPAFLPRNRITLAGGGWVATRDQGSTPLSPFGPYKGRVTQQILVNFNLYIYIICEEVEFIYIYMYIVNSIQFLNACMEKRWKRLYKDYSNCFFLLWG